MPLELGVGVALQLAPGYLKMAYSRSQVFRVYRHVIRNSHTPTTPVRRFWAKNNVLVDHAKSQTKHALFLLLSGRGVPWRDPAAWLLQ